MERDVRTILSEILEQTEAMEAALDVEDFEMFEAALIMRGALVEQLESFGVLRQPGEIAVLNKVAEMNDRCARRLAALKEKTGEMLKGVRAERLNLQKANNVQNRYQGIFDMDVGYSFDSKK